uniref:Anaphase-promoting complex subunit 4 WD40 domain-containing protein n=1 Tax=Globisporangium ultimum (strain ATCC 200006 / CBS 805.95 / DAOM BR144) TaxID=431595 RepID=K3WS75_GLOUD
MMHLAPELLTPRRTAARGADAVNTATLTYSTDGKYLFQREAHVIRVLNTKNGQLLHECIRSEAQPLGAIAGDAKAAQENKTSDSTAAAVRNGDRQQVTALALHPHNALQLIASYEDGKVLVWDFSEEKILQEFDAKASILWMESSSVSPSMLMMVVTPEDSTVAASKWSLIEFNMKKKRRGRTLLEQSKLTFKSASMGSYKDSNDAAATTSDDRFNGDYVVIVAGARMFGVRVQREQDGSVGMGRPFTTQKYTHLRDVTCVAVHPSAAEFVIGDSLGQLYRHHGQGAATTSKMHWHAHAVKCVTYSSDGNFLVSGGEECVFVSWHIESGRRSYLPRRSASLSAIATRADGAGYAIALEDHVLFQYNHITKEEEWHALGLA